LIKQKSDESKNSEHEKQAKKEKLMSDVVESPISK
jgi:hypothetical protein